MRSIGKLDTSAQAKVFGDYLYSQDIDHSVDEGKDGWTIWISDEQHLEQARKDLKSYLFNPKEKRFTTKVSRKKKVDEASQVVHMRDRWQGPTLRDAPVTMVMIAVCVVVFFMNEGAEPVVFLNADNIGAIYSYLFYWPPLFQAGEYWRLITPMFGHFGMAHLGMNMLALFSLGKIVEAKTSTIFYITLTILLSICATLAQDIFTDHQWRSLGYSGVIYGLFGYGWIRDRCDPWSNINMPSQWVRSALTFFVICWVLTSANMMSIANWAHTGGLLAGMGMGYLHAILNRSQRESQSE